jgi:branched-subunit amino acid aminotransferase/4-amino-4-deoxychorismate lyase
MINLFINGQAGTANQNDFLLFHGRSVFTTLRSRDKKLVLWPQHWARLENHARYFSFQLPSEKIVLDCLDKNLALKNSDQKIRVMLAENEWAFSLEDYQAPSSEIYEGVRVHFSQELIHPVLGRFKTACYLPYALALREAQQALAFEGILKNHEGMVVDGARSSILLFEHNCLTVLLGGLDGIMREEAVHFSRKSGVTIVRKELKENELKGQMLLANSLFGIVPVGAPQEPFVRELIAYFRMDRKS